jgi:hypothetical protein
LFPETNFESRNTDRYTRANYVNVDGTENCEPSSSILQLSDNGTDMNRRQYNLVMKNP